jgi:hypothetical protein
MPRSHPAPSASCWAGSPTCCSSTRELTRPTRGPQRSHGSSSTATRCTSQRPGAGAARPLRLPGSRGPVQRQAPCRGDRGDDPGRGGGGGRLLAGSQVPRVGLHERGQGRHGVELEGSSGSRTSPSSSSAARVARRPSRCSPRAGDGRASCFSPPPASEPSRERPRPLPALRRPGPPAPAAPSSWPVPRAASARSGRCSLTATTASCGSPICHLKCSSRAGAVPARPTLRPRRGQQRCCRVPWRTVQSSRCPGDRDRRDH